MTLLEAPGTAVAAARQSAGRSATPIHALVSRVLARHAVRDATLVDVGCGQGDLPRVLRGRVAHYVGCDLLPYDGFPLAPGSERILVDLNRPPYPLPDGVADVVTAIEVIEHLENPRALMREMTRLARPGGLIVVTTPNQLSLLSLVTLMTCGRFSAFKDSCYPAHITALLPCDLLRMAAECNLRDTVLRYSNSGRIPWTPWHWPRPFTGRPFSDNVLLEAVRP